MKTETFNEFTLSCPVPIQDYPNVLLAHGGGGKLMHQMIESMFVTAFHNPILETRHDGARLQLASGNVAFTTDSYVVSPLFFPGGNIGSMAVNGTVNDLAMCGAQPLYLSAGFILEEGLPMETLWQVVQAMRRAADAAGVYIVTGDTKVVDKGKGDGLYINTAGVGLLNPETQIAPASVEEGDLILLSGDIGRHGMAIMAVREGLSFESTIESDCAPVSLPIQKLLENNIPVHCLRDLTRGGLAGALIEIAEAANAQIEIEEKKIPVTEEVHGACEILGLDPMYVANEGRFIAFIPASFAEKALEVLKSERISRESSVIGRVVEKGSHCVSIKNSIGSCRILDLFSGEQLPRIC